MYHVLVSKFCNFTVGSEERETLEFSDICRAYLGPWGDRTAFAFSLCAIFGALIVFYVLMSNFLYNTGRFVYGEYITNTQGALGKHPFK